MLLALLDVERAPEGKNIETRTPRSIASEVSAVPTARPVARTHERLGKLHLAARTASHRFLRCIPCC